jgi:tagatose-1,6-bisphosphate aldolase
VKISPGKLAGMKAVSDNRGVIAAAAMDQRGCERALRARLHLEPCDSLQAQLALEDKARLYPTERGG